MMELNDQDREKVKSLIEQNVEMKSALNAIIERSENGELGTSKVLDMARIAREALSLAMHNEADQICKERGKKFNQKESQK
jgi:hypothetical protein